MGADITGELSAGGFEDYVNASARGSLYLGGSGIGSGPSDSGAYAQYELIDQIATGTTIRHDAPKTVNVHLVVSPNQPVNVNFFMAIDLTASTFSEDYARGGSALTTADYSHTMLWQGVDSVTDDAGKPVTDWTLETESGFDYAHAAVSPEPAAAALFAVPLLLARRRGRSSRK